MARPSFLRPAQFHLLETAQPGRSEVYKAVRQFLLMGLVALVVVTTPVAFWIWSEAEHHALENSKQATENLAQNVVAPLLDEGVLQGDPAALDVADGFIVDKGTARQRMALDELTRAVLRSASYQLLHLSRVPPHAKYVSYPQSTTAR